MLFHLLQEPQRDLPTAHLDIEHGAESNGIRLYEDGQARCKRGWEIPNENGD
jgi:hypothetical protein